MNFEKIFNQPRRFCETTSTKELALRFSSYISLFWNTYKIFPWKCVIKYGILLFFSQFFDQDWFYEYNFLTGNSKRLLILKYLIIISVYACFGHNIIWHGVLAIPMKFVWRDAWVRRSEQNKMLQIKESEEQNAEGELHQNFNWMFWALETVVTALKFLQPEPVDAIRLFAIRICVPHAEILASVDLIFPQVYAPSWRLTLTSTKCVQ